MRLIIAYQGAVQAENLRVIRAILIDLVFRALLGQMAFPGSVSYPKGALVIKG